MEVALQSAMDVGIPVRQVFITNYFIIDLLNKFNCTTTWRWNEPLSNLNFLMDMNGNPRLHVILKTWTLPIVNLLAMVLIFRLSTSFCLVATCLTGS